MTGLPERTTSVTTATTDVVISLKSKAAFRMLVFSGTATSLMSVIRMDSMDPDLHQDDERPSFWRKPESILNQP
jgi:hypothetical protein